MKTKSLCFISFLQATGLVAYISLVSVIFWKGNEWFGKMGNYTGPLLFLTIFAVSALISALITLGYPFTLWQKKMTKEAIRLVIYTAFWIVGFVIAGLTAFYLLTN